jgi:type II secretory ATPase GspE/PulE/Tfp pilus assembly ATPase PilB-like protein
MDFDKALASVMRQDPDVVAVGEIRDRDAARISVRAALTGRVVLASIHSYDAIGAAHRLTELGIHPALAASSVTTCVSQRLVRRAIDGVPDALTDGRTGLFEILPLSESLREAIAAGVPLDELRRLRAGEGRMSLRAQGYMMAASGQTTLDEIRRVLSGGEELP